MVNPRDEFGHPDVERQNAHCFSGSAVPLSHDMYEGCVFLSQKAVHSFDETLNHAQAKQVQ